jgi:hypothetical protein
VVDVERSFFGHLNDLASVVSRGDTKNAEGVDVQLGCFLGHIVSCLTFADKHLLYSAVPPKSFASEHERSMDSFSLELSPDRSISRGPDFNAASLADKHLLYAAGPYRVFWSEHALSMDCLSSWFKESMDTKVAGREDVGDALSV